MRHRTRLLVLDPALVLTIDDGHSPIPSHAEGELARDGWRRGTEEIELRDRDVGGGVRFGEVLIDGERVGRVEYRCGTARIDGELRGTSMRPCPERAEADLDVRTERLEDGKHALKRCATDFAGNRACRFPEVLRIDNNPPRSPRSLAVRGGDGWRSGNGFDVEWKNPDQDGASPVAGARWRITGPGGHDSGREWAVGKGRDHLLDLSVPRAGAYELKVWLRDKAGNSDSGTPARVRLRFDDVEPGVAFERREESGGGEPRAVRASVADEHSGPAGGRISIRRRGTKRWRELATELRRGEPGEATLRARLPGDLRPGAYLLRARARDGAGNEAKTTRREDGTEMVVRVEGSGEAAEEGRTRSGRAAAGARGKPGRRGARGRRGPGGRARTRMLAGLHWRLRRGARIAVPLRARPRLFGRLVTAAGRGLPRRRLRIVSRPAPGARDGRRVWTVRTGRGGGFRVTLPRGPSRRLTVGFRGTGRLRPARSARLSLRVRAAAAFAVSPRRLRTGEAVMLRGRVRPRSAGRRRAGKLVAIQYFETAGRRWRPVLFARADRRGRFRARYRFRYLEGAARIRLRALVPAEARWPYATGASRPVVIEVRG